MRVRGRGNSCILVLGILFWINFLGGPGRMDDEMNDFFAACLPFMYTVCCVDSIGILYVYRWSIYYCSYLKE